jgi:hemoglobin/transferrin/lactoferrin receptor protein
LSYTGRRNDGTVKLAGYPTELTRAEEDINSYAARLMAPLGDRSALWLSFDQFNQRGAGTTNLSVLVPDPFTAVDRQTRQTTLDARFNLSGDHWFDDAITVTAYYTDMAIEERRISDQRFDDIGYRTWGAQARNSANIGSNQTLTYGVEYVNERQRATRNGGPSAFFPDGNREEIGVYLQDEFQLVGGRLLVIPGFRYDSLHTSAEDEEIPSQSFTSLSPKVGATYELVDGLVVAASYGHGFRAPFFQELFPTGVHFAFPLPPYFFLALFEPNPELRPERSRSWDAGLRYSARKVRARVAYWESRVEDFIDLLPVQTLPPTQGLILQRWQSVNRQDAVLRGFEASTDWQPHPHWVLHSGYSSARGEDRSTGEALLQMPSDTLVVGLDWSRPDTGTRVAWVTRSYGTRTDVPTGVDPTDGYVLHDVHASWAPRFLRDVTLYASVNNLMNTRYEDPRFGTPGIARNCGWALV